MKGIQSLNLGCPLFWDKVTRPVGNTANYGTPQIYRGHCNIGHFIFSLFPNNPESGEFALFTSISAISVYYLECFLFQCASPYAYMRWTSAATLLPTHLSRESFPAILRMHMADTVTPLHRSMVWKVCSYGFPPSWMIWHHVQTRPLHCLPLIPRHLLKNSTGPCGTHCSVASCPFG